MSDHCWHSMPGFVYANGARRYVCCRCAIKAPGTISVVHSAPVGHGPHAPAEVSTHVEPPSAAIAGSCSPGIIGGSA